MRQILNLTVDSLLVVLACGCALAAVPPGLLAAALGMLARFLTRVTSHEAR